MKCTNCGNNAVYKIQSPEGTIYLCIDCNLKHEQAQSLEFERNARLLNKLAGDFEMAVGLPLGIPRIPIPPPPAIHTGDLKLNSIKIDRSNIGVLNTGTIKTLRHVVTTLNNSGDKDAAAAIKALTEAVAAEQKIQAEEKNKILDILSLLASEATVPKEARRKAGMRPLMIELMTIFGGIPGLLQLWQQYSPVIAGLFDIKL